MIMTAISTKFRVTLLRVGECLTENDVQNLAFLCEGIKPGRRELIRTARELFVELQGRDLLNERNVSVLSGWLEDLNLLEALRLLKEYSETFLQSVTQLQERCIQHEDLVLKYFCTTCDSKVCSDCALNLHDKNSHDVIKIDEINNEVSRRSNELERKIEAMSKRSEVIQENWGEKKQFFSNYCENIRKEIVEDTILLHEKVEKHKLSLLKLLDEKEITNFKSLVKEREDIDYVMCKLSNVNKEIYEISGDSTHKLRRLNEVKVKCSDIQVSQGQQETKVKKRCVDVLYKKVANDGVCGTITFCSLLGGATIGEDQIVHFLDDRRVNAGVRLVCFDPKDINKQYWKHLVNVNDHQSPAFVSATCLFTNGNKYILFAVGRTFYVVLLSWTNYHYDSVKSVLPLLVDDIREGSWITSIMGYSKDGDEENDRFLFSVSDSTLLREYHASGEALRKIEIRDFVSSITFCSYTHNLLSIIVRGGNDVMLLSDESTVKQSGSLTAKPQCNVTGALPICVFWTGATWLVLFVSYGPKIEWRVLEYFKMGNFSQVCAEGISCNNSDIPISISRWGNIGYISFADNTVRCFKY